MGTEASRRLAIEPVLQGQQRLVAAQFSGSGGINPPALEEALQATARRRAADARISAKWRELGGSPGAPVVEGDGGLISVGDGFYREYSKAKDRIYYRPGTEPFFIYGAIADRYIQVGGPAGWLGWPTAEEEPFTEGGRAVSFQNGGIHWWPDTGAIESGNVVVRYSGIYAFGETDDDQGSAGDELYGIFTVVRPQPATELVTRTRIYGEGNDDSVDAHEARIDNIELYRGPPYGLGISMVLMEHDFSDADKKRESVSDGVQDLHKAGIAAAGAIPVVGVAVAAALEAGWQEYGDDIKKAVNDTLHFEDDYLDTESLHVSAKQMLMKTREPRLNWKGIDHNLISELFSGDGGSWKTYFIVEAEPHAASAPAPEAQPRTLEIAQSLWSTRQDLARTQRNFADANTVGWAHAERAATEICTARGFAAGHFTGHQDLTKGDFGLLCRGEGTVWRDVSVQEIAATNWAFSEVDQVNWAQAARAAERLCAAANGGFAGGQFNGHQANGKYGLYCYGTGSRWFDASDAELAATGFGFATPRLDDVPWAQAMRAAYGFCQGKGFAAGFMNGHQAPNKYGVVCQGSNGAKPLGRIQVPGATTPRRSICEAAASARARASPAAPGLERQCELSKASQ